MESEDSIIPNDVVPEGEESRLLGAAFDSPTDVHESPWFETDFLGDIHRLLAHAYRAVRGNRPGDAVTHLEEAERVRLKGIGILGEGAPRLIDLRPMDGDLSTLLEWTEELRMLTAWLRSDAAAPEVLRIETRDEIAALIDLQCWFVSSGNSPQVPCLTTPDGDAPPPTTGERLDRLLRRNLVPHDIAVILCMQQQARLEGYERLIRSHPPIERSLARTFATLDGWQHTQAEMGALRVVER